ncbi:MAG: GNAT family N-acetyltransferase [Nocardioides sp.]|jgi:predicted GNAT family acetyltransferase
MTDVRVVDNPEAARFEGWVGDALAGFAEYRLRGDRIVFTHTEVDPAYAGRGVGTAIAHAALDAVRADGELHVVPLCPFIKAWIDKHPAYADLVAT